MYFHSYINLHVYFFISYLLYLDKKKTFRKKNHKNNQLELKFYLFYLFEKKKRTKNPLKMLNNNNSSSNNSLASSNFTTLPTSDAK
jgi:hypothetical protein